MARQRRNPIPPPDAFGRRDYDGVSGELLTASISAAVDPIKSELRWQRWMLFALAAAVFSPKIGGPPVPTVALFLAEPSMATHAVRLIFHPW